MLRNKTGVDVSGGMAAWGLAGYQSVGGEQLFSLASLFFLGFCFPLSLLFFFLFSLQFKKITIFFLNYETGFYLNP